MAEQKTNVMRLLDQKKIWYAAHEYPHGDEAVDGRTVAAMTGRDPAQVFKTLVAKGASGKPYVFVIPVDAELELKKAAKAVREKSVAMLPVSQLLGLTGYVRGGCSPIGMKKFFRTVIDSTAAGFDAILFSAGKIGFQVETGLTELRKVIDFDLGDLCV